ncbi:hypothetical protein HL653_04710 [Sphingomonas sp. AP4-R1]|uniref:hypothetical protein n=1 Tax=Sphingomonas sp. AP4-R1 TaxID=2735134 RepID=UPI001493D21C|nr:hypothetical protein [Sphingomonas sp. AP4-R1]QJU57184.1 hypothetical protein HL653_04710 [Sphingomonas sp. AP4-R1]
MKGRQGRFLLIVIGGWALARAAMLWPTETPLAGEAERMADSEGGERSRRRAPPRVPVLALPPGREASRRSKRGPLMARPAIRTIHGFLPSPSAPSVVRIDAPPVEEPGSTPPRIEPGESPAPPSPPAPRPASRDRIEAQAYLFIRPGSGRALAAGSALGGSQAAIRIAVPIDGHGHVAAAARVYAPLAAKGAEAALGIDWRPLANRALRVSVERRQRFDSAGRSAWSAYAAGGVYRALGPGLLLDAYAQAGIVGARQRDRFADGAIRIERPATIGPVAIGLGGGLWGAAQPGAARLDIGPRAVARLPVADHVLSLAVEGRFRVAGNARPGSGVAMTLAADL